MTDLDVGTQDDLHVLRFHAKETSNGRTFRWSRDTSYVSLVGVSPGSREVTLWMDDGGRPAAVPAAQVTISLQLGYQAGQPPSIDQVLGTVAVRGGFKPYTVPIAPALAETAAAASDPVRFKLTTSVWVPRQVLGTPDDRDLGVMLDRVAVK